MTCLVKYFKWLLNAMVNNVFFTPADKVHFARVGSTNPKITMGGTKKIEFRMKVVGCKNMRGGGLSPFHHPELHTTLLIYTSGGTDPKCKTQR